MSEIQKGLFCEETLYFQNSKWGELNGKILQIFGYLARFGKNTDWKSLEVLHHGYRALRVPLDE